MELKYSGPSHPSFSLTVFALKSLAIYWEKPLDTFLYSSLTFCSLVYSRFRGKLSSELSYQSAVITLGTSTHYGEAVQSHHRLGSVQQSMDRS